MNSPTTSAILTGVSGNIVSIESAEPIMKNEVAYIVVNDRRLKAEVLRVYGNRADLQVFEETQGVQVGDAIELSKEMLSAVLGPGLLGTVFDGLQNPLHDLAKQDGFFLQRGRVSPPLDVEAVWSFEPTCQVGDVLSPGDVLGTVPERKIEHKIMVPVVERSAVEVIWLAQGTLRVQDPVARIRDARGNERELTMCQTWPVRRPLPVNLLRNRSSERLFPDQRMTTTIRLIDTFFPIARGGTACIPGPFGAGKTVLQGLVARYSSVDVVVVVACGERAGEVVETVTEFSTMDDPNGSGKLMDRTVIICNTSSMPVAAREASIYMGITIGEYYRQMGLNVLLIADSTSRWAQAMRETSGRLEEIPGEEAFPAYLDSSIKSVYERAGVIRTNDETIGSLTMIGTVSPAGGNFDEPVTQSTLGAVKCFLGLSSERAYKRFYPAIDPLMSWSRYLDQLQHSLDQENGGDWTAAVKRMNKLLHLGDSIQQMMQVTGEEGISIDDFVVYHKAIFLDMVFLQQDAFDPVDVSVPVERQRELFRKILEIADRNFAFETKSEIREFFTRLTGLFKNLNYANWNSEHYRQLLTEITELQQNLIAPA